MERRDLDGRLASLRDEADPRRRRLLALGLLTAQLAPLGIEPILVGRRRAGVLHRGRLRDRRTWIWPCRTGPTWTPRSPPWASARKAASGITPISNCSSRRRRRPAFRGRTHRAPRPSVEGLRVVIVGVEDLLIDRLRAWVTLEERGKMDAGPGGSRTSTRTAWTGATCARRTGELPEEREALERIEQEVGRA